MADAYTVSIAELFWLLVVCSGLFLSFDCLREALRDLRALTPMQRRAARTVAEGTVRDERLGLAAQGAFLVAGTVAAMTPGSAFGFDAVQSIVIPLCVVVAEGLLVASALFRRQTRRDVLDAIADEEQRVRIAEATHGRVAGLRDTDPSTGARGH